MTETARRKPAWRRWWFWLLVLALASLVTGFGVIPLYLSSTIPDRVEQALGWDLETGDVSFNPFTFTLSADDVNAVDDEGERVFAADEVILDLGLLQLVRGSFNAQQLTLESPFLRVDLLPGGSTNLAEDWREHGGSGSDGGSKVQWMLGDGVVNGGRLQIRRMPAGDGGEPRTFTAEAVGLTVSDVANTEQDEAGSYTLQAAMGDQVLEGQGSLNIAPLWSNGRLSLNDVGADALQNWLGDYLPWRVQGGRISFETAYQFAHDDRGIALATRQGQLDAASLEITAQDDPDQMLASADTLAMQGVAFNMDGPELVISSITGQSLRLNAVMTGDGTLNLARALNPGEEPPEQDNGGGDSLRWSVGRVEISKGTIDWRDERPTDPVELTLQEMELNLGAMTEQLEEPVTYQARAALAQGGTASANGQFTLAPLTFEGGVTLDQLALAPFNGYLAQVSELEVRDGMLSLSGNIDIDVQDDPLTGTFSGRGSISQFSGRLPDEDQSTLAWRELRLDPIEYNFAPARLELGTVTLSEPEIGVVQYPNRPLNLVRFLGPANGDQDDQGDSADENGEAAPGLIFRLRQLDLANGEIRYTDHTPRPSFNSRLHDVQASVAGLSNIRPQQGRFSLRGILDESGEFRAQGSIATLGTEGRSEVEASLEGLSLPALNPYFSFYLGYLVDSGKLSGEGRYELQGTQLEATNTLVLERLELGEAVQSDSEITAPVRLGLALLRDDDNRVSLDIPVSGDLADPEFNLGPVMMRTLRASLVKAAMSPFNLLGSIVDLGEYSPEELGGVDFLAGETTLAMGEYTKMETVARVLDARDEIVLTIRGIALESVDRPALETTLAEEQSLPDDALEILATQRGTSLKSLLEEEYGVSGEQIFLKAPEVRSGDSSEGPVTIEFELESR